MQGLLKPGMALVSCSRPLSSTGIVAVPSRPRLPRKVSRSHVRYNSSHADELVNQAMDSKCLDEAKVLISQIAAIMRQQQQQQQQPWATQQVLDLTVNKLQEVAAVNAKYNDSRLTAIDKSIEGLDTQLGGLTVDMTDVKRDVTDVKRDVTDIKKDVADITTQLGGITTQLGGITTQLNGITTQLGGLAGLPADVADIKDELSGVNIQLIKEFAGVNNKLYLFAAVILVIACAGSEKGKEFLQFLFALFK